MKEEIKKKFLDILFEPEEDELVIEEKLKDVTPFEEGDKALKAKDILYAKSNKTTSFIDLVNGPKKQEIKKPTIENKPYEVKKNISPMFGYVEHKDEEEVLEEVKKVDIKPIVNPVPPTKQHNSYLGTVISPYFGTNVENDFSNTLSLSIRKIEKTQEENLMNQIKKEVNKSSGIDLLTDIVNVEDAKEFKPMEIVNEDTFEEEIEEKLDDEFFEDTTDYVPEFAKPESTNFNADDLVDLSKIIDPEDDFSRFKEHTGDTEEIDLLEDLFPGEE